MPVLLEEDMNLKLPKMHKVRQSFSDVKLENVAQTVKDEIQKRTIREKILPGQRIAVAVGSRGIKNSFLIVKTIIEELKGLGADPYIVSAMGSHGNGTEKGQREILEGYGITKENLGVEIVTTVDVVKIGKTSKGFDVYFDRAAYEADLVIPVNRVKLHTDFVGELQSGLCKMLVIGLGNQIGCSSIHEEDPDVFADILEEAAGIIIKKANIGFGVAILENAYDETLMIEAVPAENIISREKELVRIAKENMPILMIPDFDILVVEEIGKNISGAGYDPNVIGRSSVLKKYVMKIPSFKRMILLDITRESHGNGIGVGLFDVITRNVFEKLDMTSMYANAIACKCIDDVKIPIVADSEDEAIRVAIKSCRGIDRENLRIVKMKNTLALEHIYVSEALLDIAKGNDRLSIV
ncbi:MAG TPA: lactate racemase domain-containing protein [Negativicutes bacterium]|nr:lactate racemase domain-containing protein [Negativicutes bacterium]